MEHRPQAWGRPRNDVYGAYDPSYLHSTGPKQVSAGPTVTGTSVVAVKFKDGVVMAADNLASYGSLARFDDVKRLRTFCKASVVGFGGDIADMQFLSRHLTELEINEAYEDPDGTAGSGGLNAANLFKYLSKVMYNRRSKMDPLWNSMLVAGLDASGKPYLGQVGMLGSSFTAPSLATGYGAFLCQPILRRLVGTDADAAHITRDEAVKVIRDCMKVLWYRDGRALDRFSMAVVTKDGVELSEDERLQGQAWDFAPTIKGYGNQTS